MANEKGEIPKRDYHPPLKPPRRLPRPNLLPRPHIHEHHVARRIHLLIILIQIRRHRRPTHPHHLIDVFRDPERDGEEWREHAGYAHRSADGMWEGRVAGAEVCGEF